MRIFNINKGIIGSGLIQDRAIRFAYMITKEAIQRAQILTFFKEHGLKATEDAFGVKRSTLYLWKKKLREGNGKLESLNNKSKAPKKRNRRRTDYRIEEYIIKQRERYPIGKAKLAKMIKPYCVQLGIDSPSESTIGRIIKDLKNKGLLHKYDKLSLNGRTGKLHIKKRKKRKKLRRKGYKANKPGALVQIDTIVFFINGVRRYIITAIDLHTRIAYAKAYKTASSASARDFFKELEQVLPFNVTHIQTDNGSEFEKYFRKYIADIGITHFNTYPRSPKMNAYIERFNGTLQREFANSYLNLLSIDIDTFQTKLTEYLLWYNTERPHEGIGLVSPLWYFSKQLVTESKSG